MNLLDTITDVHKKLENVTETQLYTVPSPATVTSIINTAASINRAIPQWLIDAYALSNGPHYGWHSTTQQFASFSFGTIGWMSLEDITLFSGQFDDLADHIDDYTDDEDIATTVSYQYRTAVPLMSFGTGDYLAVTPHEHVVYLSHDFTDDSGHGTVIALSLDQWWREWTAVGGAFDFQWHRQVNHGIDMEHADFTRVRQHLR